MQKPLIIAIVGLLGSGKSEATSRFIEHDFARVGFNDSLYEELEKRGLKRVQEHERPVREEMRREFGMAVMAERALSKVERTLSKMENVVIESLYSWSEYKLMKEKFGEQFSVLAIYAPPQARYERLSRRAERPLTFKEAEKRDSAEIENIEKAGPIAMADWTVQNTETKEEFFKEIDRLIDEILS